MSLGIERLRYVVTENHRTTCAEKQKHLKIKRGPSFDYNRVQLAPNLHPPLKHAPFLRLTTVAIFDLMTAALVATFEIRRVANSL